MSLAERLEKAFLLVVMLGHDTSWFSATDRAGGEIRFRLKPSAGVLLYEIVKSSSFVRDFVEAAKEWEKSGVSQ